MRTSALKYAVLSAISKIGMLMLALMPFHAFLTVWISTGVGHYTAVRLWKEVLLVIIGIGAIFLVTLDNKIRDYTLSRRLVWFIQAYAVVVILRGSIAWLHGDVTNKAFGYGLIVDLRYLAFFLIMWSVAVRATRLRTHWKRLVIWPVIVVVAFGLLQAFVLPNDFLKHFGYGSATIPPFETINSNSDYMRIPSTLRGANPLGAYMILPISVMAVLLARSSTRRNWHYVLLAASYLVLFLSFSRSAFVGAGLATLIVLATHINFRKVPKHMLYASAVLFIVFLGGLVSLRHNSRFENIVFHTETNSQIKTTSDAGHFSAVRDGVKDILHEPFGHGVGTAGPASVYNEKPARIAENYYIQIGQESGWVGMALFIVITLAVGYLLWIRRTDSLALSLFAAFVGLAFVNMLSHAWTDDTLAYVFWGLAGIAMVTDVGGQDTHPRAPKE
ncbi:MAG: O-antigen ligase family protein [Patescibacteria group bacterium]|nr:O-antigen ligase family protein [Patescibacteria group bacterium]